MLQFVIMVAFSMITEFFTEPPDFNEIEKEVETNPFLQTIPVSFEAELEYSKNSKSIDRNFFHPINLSGENWNATFYNKQLPVLVVNTEVLVDTGMIMNASCNSAEQHAYHCQETYQANSERNRHVFVKICEEIVSQLFLVYGLQFSIRLVKRQDIWKL